MGEQRGRGICFVWTEQDRTDFSVVSEVEEHRCKGYEEMHGYGHTSELRLIELEPHEHR